MQRWLRLATTFDRFAERTGRFVYWLTLAMVLIGSYNAIARYTEQYTGLNLSSNMWLELQWYLFSLVFLLGAAYGLKHDVHVRVDVVYESLSRRGRAWINLLGTLLFLFPFSLVMLVMSWPMVRNSWAVWEQSPDPGGLPRYPIKTIIPIAFLLLIVQGVAFTIRQVAVLRGQADSDEQQPEDA
ncbi:MAG: TRAP transporter small permease subunit [Bacteroidetes bacterium]|nr:TRAP transporter small permease subunit [Bacteroidota bacterium]